eukprot:m.9931 g.9931  ORF g.9931 m.9931 type:complete len:53 (-) comp5865_c0_seq1:312-470(-)
MYFRLHMVAFLVFFPSVCFVSFLEADVRVSFKMEFSLCFFVPLIPCLIVQKP